MTRRYDVVVVGGGIHGAGVAQAAAAAGHSVLLVERHDLAHGTSSRSSKLIHGGLRYLETGQLRLVRESLMERQLLLRLAPELVRLRPFFVPVYATTRRRPWQLWAGLSLYAALGSLAPATRFGTLPRRQWGRLDGLEQDGLQQVFRYFDAQTDDARLTRAVTASAVRLGAELALHTEFVEADVAADGVAMVVRCGDRGEELRTRVLVNAAGPWAPRVAARIRGTPSAPDVELVQGTHLLLAGQMRAGIYYVESPDDGRAVFVMPWKGTILLGTTETLYRGDPEDVAPLPQETDYLLRVLAHYFPAYGRGATRLLGAFAGLRVLPRGGRAFGRSRETLLHTDRGTAPRTVSIYGGKLTGWRSTAARVLERIAASLPCREVLADTRELRLDPVD
ncbi:MAG: FAD-dependent oxidoreductase [Steroidobacteraceae bacterium]